MPTPLTAHVHCPGTICLVVQLVFKGRDHVLFSWNVNCLAESQPGHIQYSVKICRTNDILSKAELQTQMPAKQQAKPPSYILVRGGVWPPKSSAGNPCVPHPAPSPFPAWLTQPTHLESLRSGIPPSGSPSPSTHPDDLVTWLSYMLIQNALPAATRERCHRVLTDLCGVWNQGQK